MTVRRLKIVAASSMGATYAFKTRYRRERSTTCTDRGGTDVRVKAKRNSATHQA